MKFPRLRSGFTPKTTILALLSALACAGASWTFDAGSALAPGPADLTTPLVGGTGATASAFVVEQQRSTVLLWPVHWQPGPSIVVGTPCSPYGLPAGARTTSRIEGIGTLRRCVDFDPTMPPPANAVRPLPPMPVQGGDGTEACSGGIATKATDAVTVISWPADWQSWDSGPNGPYPGQPCSDFPLLAGETTYKHIQSQVSSGSTEGPFRCVRMKDPIIYPGP